MMIQIPNPPPPGGGDVTITGLTGDPHFWGDLMTIQGTGFSAVVSENVVKFISVPSLQTCGMNFTSDGGDIQIESASATGIQIRVPYKEFPEGAPCGPESATIEVTVKGKKATFPGVKFIGLPYIGMFKYHYGWFDVPHVTRIGDSVMIEGGLAGFNARTSGFWDAVRLSVDGMNVPIKFRTIGLESGWAFYLPAADFAQPGSCTEEPDGWAARKETFSFHIFGVEKSASRDLYIQNLPARNASCAFCPTPQSIGNGVENKWIIRGNYVGYYTEAIFAPTTCGGPAQSVAVIKNGEHEIQFAIPFSILAPGCSYTVLVGDECKRTEMVGSL